MNIIRGKDRLQVHPCLLAFADFFYQFRHVVEFSFPSLCLVSQLSLHELGSEHGLSANDLVVKLCVHIVISLENECLSFVREYKLAAAQALWDSALDRLRAVEAEMKKLMDEFEATKAEEDKLKAQKEDCEKKFKRANSLIEKLAGEKVSWQSSLAS